MGKSIEEYHKLQLKLAKSMPVGDFVLEVTTCVGMIFRWGYDNLAFLEKAKVVDAAGYGVKSNKFRVVATVAYIILCLKALARCSTDCAKANDTESLKKSNDKRFEAMLGLVARCCDMMNALNSAKYYQTNAGIQGLCGLFSSLCGVRKVIKAMK